MSDSAKDLITATEKIDSALSIKQPTRVEAVYLQLVMEAIWEEAQEQGMRELNLKILNDLGGVKSIVQEYLNKAIKKLDTDQTGIAYGIFDYLVMPSGDKVFYTKSGLATRVRKSEEELERVLDVLSDSRILKQVDPSPNRPDEPRYTIFHDRLAEPILKWQSDYAKQTEIETLKQQQAEKSKKYWWALIAACLALLVLSGITIYALYQKNEVLEQKKNAHEADQKSKVYEDKAKEALKEANEKVTKIIEDLISTSKDEKTKNILVDLLQQLSGSERQPTNIEEPVTSVDTILQKQWQNGQTLHIKFLGGDQATQEKVKEIAQEWTKNANLKFVFDSSPNAEIRISFNSSGSWSYMGTDAVNISPVGSSNPTMDLGILKYLNRNDAQFRRTVLHEFGHVLGFFHEFQNANANIPWNKDYIYKYFGGQPNYWDREAVDFNLFKKYKSDKPFDRQSIMMYTTIPKEWLLDNSFEPITELSTDLSEGDKAYARKIYPFE